MPIDTSIYANALRPPPSIQDYDAQNQQFQTNQLQIQQARQAQSDQNALRQAAMQMGNDPGQNLQLLRQQGLYAPAQAYQKSLVDNQKTQSEIGLNTTKSAEQTSLASAHDLESKIKTHDFAVQQLGAITDPSQVAQWLHDNTGPNKAFSYDQGMQGYQAFQQAVQQPGGFEAWKQKALQGGMSATEQLKQQQALQIANQTNATSLANNQATNQAHLQGIGMTNATTRRGQDLVNSRAGEALMQPEYKQQDDGTWVALPKKVAAGAPITATQVTDASGKPLLGAGKPLTEGQGKATTFAARMQDAEGAIGELEKAGIKGSDLRTIAAGNAYTNFLASPQGQQYRQAQENWVTANLRQESGAAIGKDEMAKDVAKFFAKPGDSDAVITQKARARSVAAQGMLAQAGPGAKQVPSILKNAGAATSPHPADITDLLNKYGAK